MLSRLYHMTVATALDLSWLFVYNQIELALGSTQSSTHPFWFKKLLTQSCSIQTAALI